MLAHHLAEHRRSNALSSSTSLVSPSPHFRFNRIKLVRDRAYWETVTRGDDDHAQLSMMVRTHGNLTRDHRKKHPAGQSSNVRENDKRRFLSGGVKWRTQKLLLRLLVSHKNIPKTAGAPNRPERRLKHNATSCVCVRRLSLSLSPLCPFAEKSAAHSNIHPLVMTYAQWYIKLEKGTPPLPHVREAGSAAHQKKRAEQRRV